MLRRRRPRQGLHPAPAGRRAAPGAGRRRRLGSHAGECVALAGPSGAGKSTLMRALYGNYRADRGRILVRHDGAMVDIAGADPRTVLDVAPRHAGLCQPVPARGPARAGARRRGRGRHLRGGRSTGARRGSRAADRLNIPQRLHGLPPATFSGGEQQRVNIARGFIGGHPMLLLDEPTASLDAANRDVVVGMIREAKARGAAHRRHLPRQRGARRRRRPPLCTSPPLQDAA